ncbi:MAG TPA: uracil phosphoribosyltransferase [Ktedonobacterales bacterium]
MDTHDGAVSAAPHIALPMRGVAQPTREDALALPNVRVTTHPLIAHKLTALRDRTTTPDRFAALTRELGALLAYEAMADLELEPAPIETPLEPMIGSRIRGEIAIAPVLRAGLGMAEGFRQALAEARVAHIGLRRDEETLRPIAYYQNLNHLHRAGEIHACFMLDPMLATGGSAIDTLTLLKQYLPRGLRLIALIAAPYGLVQLRQAHPDVPVIVAAVDDRLDDRGYIRPGLGDAGDRQFNTL